MVGARIATSPEAEGLLDAMPTVVRSLATSLQTQTERCLGNLRGPVLWSETMSARASSFGDEGLFVCKTPSRAYDIDENRVLVASLVMIADAARGAEHNNERALDDPVLRGGAAQRQRGQPLRPAPVAGPGTPRASQRPRHQAHPLGQAPQGLPTGARHARALRQPTRRAGRPGPVRRAHPSPAPRADRPDGAAGASRFHAAAGFPRRAGRAVHRTRCSTTTGAGWAIAPACRGRTPRE